MQEKQGYETLEVVRVLVKAFKFSWLLYFHFFCLYLVELVCNLLGMPIGWVKRQQIKILKQYTVSNYKRKEQKKNESSSSNNWGLPTSWSLAEVKIHTKKDLKPFYIPYINFFFRFILILLFNFQITLDFFFLTKVSFTSRWVDNLKVDSW